MLAPGGGNPTLADLGLEVGNCLGLGLGDESLVLLLESGNSHALVAGTFLALGVEA